MFEYKITKNEKTVLVLLCTDDFDFQKQAELYKEIPLSCHVVTNNPHSQYNLQK